MCICIEVKLGRGMEVEMEEKGCDGCSVDDLNDIKGTIGSIALLCLLCCFSLHTFQIDTTDCS